MTVEAAKPENEVERLQLLRDLNILDTAPEKSFDRITRLASYITGAPIVLVSLVDEDRQWFKSAVGLDAKETGRNIAFCSHAILREEVMIVSNALEDSRFRQNPLVTGAPNIRFYAGAPLVHGSGLRLGTLCAIDREPREFSAEEEAALRDLAAIVVDELVLRQIVQEQQVTNAHLRLAQQAQEQFAHMASHDLRSPLKTIINMTEMVMCDVDAKNKASLEFIHDASTRLEDIVAGFRRLSKLQCGPKDERTLASLVAEAQKQVDEALVVEIQNDMPIMCDPALMTQLCVNLMNNVLRHASSPHIVFDLQSSGEGVILGASNSIHEPMHVDASIFAPFRRFTTSAEGTGLGLAIVDRVAQLHGGTATASSHGKQFLIEVSLPT